MRTISVLVIALSAAWSAYGAKPSGQWDQGQWASYIDLVVSISAGEAVGSAGAEVPMVVDLPKALNAMPPHTKLGLQLWLNGKTGEAYGEKQLQMGDGYRAFYQCLTWEKCEDLKELEMALK